MRETMKKTDYSKIAEGLATFDHENRTHSRGALFSIFCGIHPLGEQAPEYQHFLTMDKAYSQKLDELMDGDKSPTQIARERHEKEALGRKP